MSTVKFATLCDLCGARSLEYQAHATCRECLEDVCPDCSTEIDPESGTALCRGCEHDRLFSGQGALQ